MSFERVVDAIRASVADGESIIESTFADYGIRSRGPRLEYVPAPPAAVIASEPPVSPATRLMLLAILEADRCGRRVTAALALYKLRERYEEAHRAALPEDERTWSAFVCKYLPTIGVERAELLLGSMLRQGGPLRCRRCASETRCACACGVPYVPAGHPWATPASEPTALERATAALAADPGKSNRAIARQIGVSFETVRRAKQKLADAADHVSPDVSEGGDGD